MTTAPYERVQLFSGGGSRFGYYLGSYAALVEQGHAPDLILATCGGSLSALLVQIAPDPKDLRQLMGSRELYEVISNITHVTADNRSRRIKWRRAQHALMRWQGLHRLRQPRDGYAKLLDELHQLAMFEINNEPQWLDALMARAPQFATDSASVPDIALIASRLYQAKDAEQPAVQLQEILFAPQRLCLEDKLPSCVSELSHGRVHQQVLVRETWDVATAVRASMADMYYLPPIHIQTLGWCLGGVINLTPIELACQLGATVFAETKAGYDAWLAAPAIRRVFGFDPNVRLAQVHAYQADAQQLHWLPLADNAAQLAEHQVQKRFHLKTASVQLIHSDYEGFVQQMQAQWDYGYRRTADYLQQASGHFS